MRYSKSHKPQTRHRIVTKASHLFRQHGYSATGVDAVMKSAGLTPGGFYAHFPNKSSLLAESLSLCLSQKSSTLSTSDLQSLITHYLTPQNRDHPSAACPLPSLAAEIARQAAPIRKSFTTALRNHLASLSTLTPGTTPDDRFDQAITILSTLAGSMLLARAVNDPKLSNHILRASQTHLLANTNRSAKKRAKP